MNVPQPHYPDELFTAADVAGFCQVDLKTIHNWANKGSIVHFRTPGRHLRFRRLDLVDFFRRFGYPIPNSLLVTKGRIVIIDHETHQLAAVRKALSSRFDLTCFHDPFDGLIALGTIRPHVLVFDPNCPYIDGVHMLQKLSSISTTAHIRTVVYCSDQQLYDRCVEAGVSRFIVKSDVTELRSALEYLMGL